MHSGRFWTGPKLRGELAEHLALFVAEVGDPGRLRGRHPIWFRFVIPAYFLKH